MAKAYYEVFASDTVIIYIGLIIIGLGIFVFSQFTQGWVWNLQSPAVWGIIGLIVLCAGFCYWGAISGFRHRTKKLFAGNHVFELAWGAPIPVTTAHPPVDMEMIKQDFPQIAAQLKQGPMTAPPEAAVTANDIPLWVYELGGVDAHGFHSLEGGQQGYLIVYGLNRMIDFGVAMLCPFYLELVDHSKVDHRILTWLKANRSNFRENVSPIYYVGPLATPMERWAEQSRTLQSVVLRSIGFDGLAHRFVTTLENLMATSNNASKFKTAWTKDSVDAIVKAFNTWMNDQPVLRIAMSNGEALAEGMRALALTYLAELNFVTGQHEQKKDELLQMGRARTVEARRRVSVAGGSPSLGASYELASRPAIPSEQR